MTDYLKSLARTVVPAGWGTALAWLVAVGVLDADQSAAAAPFAELVLVPVVIGGYYAGVRLLERQTWAPRWAVGLLLGWPAAPAYPDGRHALR